MTNHHGTHRFIQQKHNDFEVSCPTVFSAMNAVIFFEPISHNVRVKAIDKFHHDWSGDVTI
jgi:hypothetical protein